MEYLRNIKTQFVKDRVKETTWENRQYIVELQRLESIIEQRGPHSMGGAMIFHSLKGNYPVEYECIKRELDEGIFTSPEEFAELKKEHQLRKLAEERQKSEQARLYELAKLEQEQREYEMWVKMGGRV